MDLSKLPPEQVYGYKSQKYSGFIASNTRGCEVACELGAGVFHNFVHIRSKLKVGIELIPEYVNAKAYNGVDCLPIVGNALNFNMLLDEVGVGHVDVFLMCDFLEHLDRPEAVGLIGELKKRGNRIIVFVPGGTCNQHGHEHHTFGDRVKLADESHAIEAQRHKSTWYKKDLEELDFIVEEVTNYHNPDKDRDKFGEDGGSVLWAVWNYQKTR